MMYKVHMNSEMWIELLLEKHLQVNSKNKLEWNNWVDEQSVVDKYPEGKGAVVITYDKPMGRALKKIADENKFSFEKHDLVFPEFKPKTEDEYYNLWLSDHIQLSKTQNQVDFLAAYGKISDHMSAEEYSDVTLEDMCQELGWTLNKAKGVLSGLMKEKLMSSYGHDSGNKIPVVYIEGQSRMEYNLIE